MKITASQTDLTALLATIGPAVSNGTSHPILNCVRLAATKGKLTASAFNLDLGITSSCAALVDTDGEVCLPYRMLAAIVARIDDDQTVTIAADGTLTSVSGSYGMPPQAAEDFPDLPMVKGKAASLALGSAVKAVLGAASTDAAKGLLNGVNAAAGHLSATDGHRMMRVAVDLPDGLDVTLPAATAKLLADQTASITTDKAHAVITLEDGTIIHSRIMDGTYPNVAQLIPSEFKQIFTANRIRLQRALERVAIVAEAHNDVVKLAAANGELLITAEADGRNGRELIAIEGDAEGSWAFNVHYLLDGIKAFRSAQAVMICANTATTPVVLKCDSMDATYLVMPVQIKG